MTFLLALIKQDVEIMIVYEFHALHIIAQMCTFTVTESRGPAVCACGGHVCSAQGNVLLLGEHVHRARGCFWEV